MNYPEQKDDASPARAPTASGEFWRRAGYELVMRCGTEQDRAEAKARANEVLAIRENVQKFLEAA